MEPKKPVQALKDPSWVEAIQDELLPFKLLNVWTSVDLPKDKWAIGTKWVFRNKKDERGIVINNKARLVAQGHTQKEGLQVQQKSDGIFVSQDKYVADILKFFGFSTVKTASTLMEPNKALVKDAEAKDTSHLHAVKRIFRYLKGQPKLGLWYPKYSPFDLEAYSDSDYARASLDRKSTIGGCQFLGKSCCGQVLWILNQLLNYGFNLMNTKIYIDNESTICIVKNPVFHSKTKHIEIRNHFIRDLYEKKLIQESGLGSGPRCQVTILGGAEAQTRFEAAFKQSNDLLLSREKPSESEGFDQIIDFLNAKPIRYALTVNPTVYASCVKQFWTTTKVKKVNDQEQIQALVDKQKVIITEESIRRDLKFDDAVGTACLPNDTIFAELARMGSIMASSIICLANNQKFDFSKYIFDNMVKQLEGGVKFLMFLRFLQVFLDKQVEGMAKHKEIYVMSSHIKKIFANIRRQGQGFSGNVTPLFETMMVIAQEEKKMKPKRKQRRKAKVHSPSSEIPIKESVSTLSNDPLPSSDDSIQLNELMIFCTSLQQQVLELEEAKIAQAKEIAKLKKRVNKLEKRRKSRHAGLGRLKKVGASKQVESSEEKDSLGAQEAESKQGRNIEDIDQDAEIALVDEAQGRMHDAKMFGVDDFEGNEVFVDVREKTVEKEVSTADPVTTAGKVVTAASVEDSAAPTTATTADVDDELTLAKTLIAIKAAKPKVISTAITTPRAKGIFFHEQVQAHKPTVSSSKDKGKAKMIKHEKPLKKKDQIALDE
nr:hypothetical protein [Tanacetum cinerariifolium]